jgi:hypothetical protein
MASSRHDHTDAADRDADRMGKCPRGAAGSREGADPAERLGERRAPSVTDGRGRRALHVRHRGRIRPIPKRTEPFNVCTTLTFRPSRRTRPKTTFLGTSFTNLDKISQARTERVLQARTDIGPPWSLWAVIFLTSGLVLGCAIIYGVEKPAMHYPMVATVGVLVAAEFLPRPAARTPIRRRDGDVSGAAARGRPRPDGVLLRAGFEGLCRTNVGNHPIPWRPLWAKLKEWTGTRVGEAGLVSRSHHLFIRRRLACDCELGKGICHDPQIEVPFPSVNSVSLQRRRHR